MPRSLGLSSYDQGRRNRRRRNTTNQEEDLITTQRRIFGANYNLARDETLNEDLVSRYTVGTLTQGCTHCLAQHFTAEKGRSGGHKNCCHYGKVVLPQCCEVRNGNQELQELFTADTPKSRNFRDNIRSYNSALAFASMKSKIVEFRSRGPYVYKIHGQIYHQISELHPQEGSDRRYGQLYMIDSGEAVNQRLEFNENRNCRRDVMQQLCDILTENNRYAEIYKKMQDMEREIINSGESVPELRIQFLKTNQADRRRYNLPVSNEIAGIFTSEDGGPPESIDFVVYPRTGGKQILKITSQHVDPMCYPLIFTFGEQGWNEFLEHNSEFASARRNSTTLLQFYSHRLAIREGFSVIHSAGKLFQQYVVDSYFKIEMSRLNFLRFNQKNLRAEHFQGILDSMAQNSNMPVGRMIILPSSFIGSPRNMQQLYQDAMAIVCKYGKADLFITFTCNPKWPEITSNLRQWEDVCNRPDLVARVFNLKLKELIDDLTHKHVLGKAAAYLYVVEFQKRGLPHAHILISLRNEDKFTAKEQIDRAVRAEIPNPTTEPLLHSIVVKHLLHGPCGAAYPSAPCMDKGICTKGYPKNFSEETVENVNGYPVYKRRNNNASYSKTISGENFVFDNRWVVPYNPFLLLKFDAHINTEICASVKSVKYIYKYVYKGHDCAQLEVTNNATNSTNDEIKQYVDCRYISPPEAIWRIFEYNLHKQSHHITRLAVHLPFQQIVYFNTSEEREAINNLKDTTLLAWFKLNQEDANAREYVYPEIPYHYTFTNNKWKTRQRRQESVISRMYSVSIADHERYCLRLLLLHVKGAKCFEDLRIVDNVLCSSFREACEKRGLLDDDNEVYNALEEASSFAMPKYLRFLFAVVCVFCAPKNIEQLWNEFREKLIEDFLRSYDELTSSKMALQDIKETLSLHSVDIASLGLPDPGAVLLETPINQKQEKEDGEKYYNSLNGEQKTIVDSVVNCVRNKQQGFYFIDGPGGTGKTHIYKTLIHMLRGENEVVIPVAWTGIAATLLPGGRTSHSRFKFPVPMNENSTSSIRPNSHDALVLRIASLIIWDEAPMAPKQSLNCLDLLLRDITQSALPFGGKCIVLGGDFRQVLPVVPRAPQAAVIESSIKYASQWNLFTTYNLTMNMRAQCDPEFCEWLLNIGNGTSPSLHTPTEDTIEIPHQIISQDIVNDIYGSRLEAQNVTQYTYSAILCPKNDDCSYINDKVLDILDGDLHEYSSIDDIDCEDENEKRNFPLEFLHSLTPIGMPPHKLKLKVGAIIMLLRNINPKRGLCNGTRLIVDQCRRYCIVARILTGDNNGLQVLIPRITLAPSDTNLPFTLKRKQFPVRLAFSMTINKSQGQTFSKIGLFLREPVFSHGQLYVAFSRCQSLQSIKVQIINGEKQGVNTETAYTSNIVCKQIL